VTPGPRRWRAVARRVALGGLGLLGVVLLGLASFPTGRYLLRAAWEEGRILARRRPIAALVADPAVDTRTRAKLRLVLDARRVRRGLGRAAARALVHALHGHRARHARARALGRLPRPSRGRTRGGSRSSGACRTRVLRVRRGARDAAAALDRARLYDAYLRPSPAFSTLGWFNDPLSEHDAAGGLGGPREHRRARADAQHLLRERAGGLQRVVRELRRARAARRGCSAAGATRPRRARRSAVGHEEQRLAAFWTALGRAVDSAYAAHPADSVARVRARDTVYARAAPSSRRASRPGRRLGGWAARVRLDNAALLARLTYGRELPLFDRVWEREGRHLGRAVRRVIALARSRPDDPLRRPTRVPGGYGVQREAPGCDGVEGSRFPPDAITPDAVAGSAYFSGSSVNRA
jgi:predicted aminopeptidase